MGTNISMTTTTSIEGREDNAISGNIILRTTDFVVPEKVKPSIKESDDISKEKSIEEELKNECGHSKVGTMHIYSSRSRVVRLSKNNSDKTIKMERAIMLPCLDPRSVMSMSRTKPAASGSNKRTD